MYISLLNFWCNYSTERMEMAAGGENVGTDESEMMDQAHMVPPQLPPQIPPQIPPRIHNTSVIVSITGKQEEGDLLLMRSV